MRSLCVRYFYYFDVVFCLCGGVEVVVVMHGGGVSVEVVVVALCGGSWGCFSEVWWSWLFWTQIWCWNGLRTRPL